MVTFDSDGKRVCLEEEKNSVSELLSPGMGRKPEAEGPGLLEAGRQAGVMMKDFWRENASLLQV